MAEQEQRDNTPLAEELTLRDYFAGKAMSAIIKMAPGDYDEDVVSINAYAMADKMLEARTLP